MVPPLISYSTFHRLGLTAKNLGSLLKTADDFELHIIDNNSQDGTWEYIKDLKDSRIKSRIRFPVNAGVIYSTNFNLARRKSNQYFIALESDVYIFTPDWITRMMEAFRTFPELGLLGIPRTFPLYDALPEIIPIEKNGVSYLQLKKSEVGTTTDFIPGHCQCLRPELINIIGYWCEENCYGDAELSVRINKYTPFKAGFTTNIAISMAQTIPCSECQFITWCNFDKVNNTCFTLRNLKHKNLQFSETFRWKYFEYFKELEQGKRTVFCASIHDPRSYGSHVYHMDWALENFRYYMENAN